MDELGANCFDRFDDTSDLVDAQVVGNDHIAGLERGTQERSDIGKKQRAVHWAIGDHGCSQSVVAQPRNEGRCFPMSMRNGSDAAFASFSSPIASRHVCRGRRLIEKHQSLDVECGLALFPFAPRLFYVWPFLLAGVQSFFYSSNPICSVDATTPEP